jgi:hypothetical protein
MADLPMPVTIFSPLGIKRFARPLALRPWLRSFHRFQQQRSGPCSAAEGTKSAVTASRHAPRRRSGHALEQPLDPRLRQNCPQQLGGKVAFQQPIAVLWKKDPTPAAPSTAAASGSNRTLAAASLATASPAGSTAGPSASTTPKNRRRAQPVHDRADRPQRMILPNSSFKIDVAEQRPRTFVLAAHDSVLAPFAPETESHQDSRE